MKRAIWILAALALLFCAAGPARADVVQTFDLTWSGTFGSSATATGQITLDITNLPNPTTSAVVDITADVTAFSITVTGASSGNGTFTLADFSQFLWSTNGGTLDLTKELVGQPTSGSPWGTTPAGGSGSGDFNFFSNFTNPAAPDGITTLQIGANGDTADVLNLTSFAPHTTTATPEPASLTLAGIAAVGLLGYAWRRRKRAAA
jgi:LPXTG-motif cell wall-anchored protein